MKCQKCHTEIKDGSKFCPVCGAQQMLSNSNVPIRDGIKEKKKSGKKGVIAAIIAGVVVIAAAITIFITFKGAKSGPMENALYIKGDAMYNLKLDGNKPVKDVVTQNLAENVTDYVMYQPVYLKYSVDHKYLFFPESGADDSMFALYCKNLKDSDEPNMKIAGNVVKYEVTSDNRVVYQTDSDNLYIHDLKTKNKIASDVAWFHVGENGKYVLWYTRENEGYALFYQDTNLKKTAEFLVKADYFAGVDSNMNNIFYIVDECLYRITDFQTPVLIDTDVMECWTNYNSPNPSFYYLKSVPLTGQYMDYVEDDLIETDATVVCPVEDDYKEKQIVTENGISKRRKVLTDEYWIQKENFENKERRDEIRIRLKEDAVSMTEYELHFYSEGKITKVLDRFYDSNWRYGSYGQGWTILASQKNEVKGKVKFSEIVMDDYGICEDIDTIESKINTFISPSEISYVLVSPEQSKSLDLETVYSVICDDKGQMIYVLEGSTLKGIHCENSDFGDTVFIDEGVDRLYAADSGKIFYLKHSYDDLYDLFCDKEMIGYDIAIKYQPFMEDNIAFISDAADDSGTLMEYKDTETVKIANDVWDFIKISDGRYVVLTDYDTSTGSGELNYYDGKELIHVDSNVTDLCKEKRQGEPK